MAEKKELFDVVVYEIKTQKIEAIVGTNMDDEREDRNGYTQVGKRINTLRDRMNENFDACAVPAGKYKFGDILDEED